MFDSEIFKDPEISAESNGLESYDYSAGFEDHHYDDLSAKPTTVINGIDSAPNTLPQILYLSYKNRGQFILDSLRYQISQAQALAVPQVESLRPEQAIEASAASALTFFTEALERDETDTELWRRTSRISNLLGSKRISRYCLESVLDDEDDPISDGLGPPGLEVGFAGEELKAVRVPLWLHTLPQADRFSF